MNQELSQQLALTQNLTQTLAPQQLLFVRLLELPVTDLEGRVRNEILENSALEEEPESLSDREEEAPTDETETFEETDPYESVSQREADLLADYASVDDIPDYLLHSVQQKSDLPTPQWGDSSSFYDSLLAQLGEYDLTEKQKEIIEYLIGSLDNDGLLRKDLGAISDELAIYHDIDATEEEITECLHTLQEFEPVGIGARSLQECLLLQLRSEDYRSPWKDKEIQIIENSYEDFTHKRIDHLAERFGLDNESMQQIFAELTRLNPRPGSGLSDTTGGNMQQIVPDFIVTGDDDGMLSIRLNRGDVPQLRVSSSFRELIDEYAKNKKNLSRDQKNAYVYAKQKADAAQSFINAIKQRQNTLLLTMHAIVKRQQAFFEEGDERLIQPMILKDIAQDTGLDISTISRVSNSKYVLTDFGVYPLKFFFNDSFVTKDGEELSKMKIKSTLRELIENEDKANPLSDDALAALLGEKGLSVARRTVAKYREQMGLPVARLRRNALEAQGTAKP